MRKHHLAMGTLFTILWAAGLALPGEASANSVASVVVAPDGRVYFSDYISNRIWEVSARGVLRVVIEGKHTHHLALGQDGSLYARTCRPIAGGRACGG